jgi:uncharacterized protein
MMSGGALSYVKKLTTRLFSSQPNDFIQRLCEHAYIVTLATETLVEYMRAPNRKNTSRIDNLEQKADDVRRALVIKLHNTFVTPIDREDLFGLSRAIDDVVDYAYSMTNEMDVLNIAPNDSLRAMTELLHYSAEEIYRALKVLEHEPAKASEHALHVRHVENQMEHLYAQTLANLFEKPDNLQDVVNILKLLEIYRHMFRSVRSARQAADIIDDIVVEFY